MEVRDVRPGEYEQAGRVVVDAYMSVPDQHVTGGYEAMLADVGRRAVEAEVLVVVDEGVIVGCATYVPDASSPWAELLEAGEAGIRMLATAPARQGRGTGGRLLDACIERARLRGRNGMLLHTTPWMHAAHRLYQRAGFVRVPARDWRPAPDIPLLAFHLDLTAPTAEADKEAVHEGKDVVRQEHNEYDPGGP